MSSGSDPRTTRFHINKGAGDVFGLIFHDSSRDTYQICDVNDYQKRSRRISRSEVATLIIR